MTASRSNQSAPHQVGLPGNPSGGQSGDRFQAGYGLLSIQDQD